MGRYEGEPPLRTQRREPEHMRKLTKCSGRAGSELQAHTNEGGFWVILGCGARLTLCRRWPS